MIQELINKVETLQILFFLFYISFYYLILIKMSQKEV